MRVDIEKCTGCSLCSQDCIVSDIEMVNGKSHIKNEVCLKCGHCLAICPVGAISSDDENEYSMDEVIEYKKQEFDIEPEQLMNFMKFRRSVRLLVNALGLGTYFSGFLSRAASVNSELRDLLQVEENEELVAAMLIGYPRVQYKRTVPRKDATVINL